MSEHRPTRPAPINPSAPAKKRGRPTKDFDAVGTHVSRDYTTRLVELKTPFEQDETDEVVGHLNRPPWSDWTEAQEHQVTILFRDLGLHDSRDRITGNSHSCLLTLFKICLRVLRVSPVFLISPVFNLRFLGTGAGATRMDPNIFSRKFCSALSGLIVHPSIEAKPEILVSMLQFAVICRLDHRHGWVIDKIIGNCPALSMMATEMKRTMDSDLELCRSISEIHDHCRSSVIAQGRDTSCLSDILHGISELTAEAAENPEIPRPNPESTHQFGHDVFIVTVEDLELVIRAIDALHSTNPTTTCTVQVALATYKTAKKGIELPAAKNLSQYWERSMKKVMRSCFRLRPSCLDALFDETDETDQPTDRRSDGSHSNTQSRDDKGMGNPKQDISASQQQPQLHNSYAESDYSPDLSPGFIGSTSTPPGQSFPKPLNCTESRFHSGKRSPHRSEGVPGASTEKPGPRIMRSSSPRGLRELTPRALNNARSLSHTQGGTLAGNNDGSQTFHDVQELKRQVAGLVAENSRMRDNYNALQDKYQKQQVEHTRVQDRLEVCEDAKRAAGAENHALRKRLEACENNVEQLGEQLRQVVPERQRFMEFRQDQEHHADSLGSIMQVLDR
ncbi:hypothetical protein FHETE_5336 [Fusarium heterosporum]|uniref:Uncharacterized protein n=1 Tax=Fusarium heterosporum TaxID=42747 RepID=A0A8H5TF10_FUSHE|nr:hypothetical protein FHETE_5336 [Fusarium heterosporum]